MFRVVSKAMGFEENIGKVTFVPLTIFFLLLDIIFCATSICWTVTCEVVLAMIYAPICKLYLVWFLFFMAFPTEKNVRSLFFVSYAKSVKDLQQQYFTNLV